MSTTTSKIGAKKAGLKVNKGHKFSEITQVNAGCSKSGTDTEHTEFSVSLTTDEILYYIKLTPKDAARIALFWMQFLPERLKEESKYTF